MHLQHLLTLTQVPFVVLDTETTGIKHPHICQIAIVRGDGQILLDTLVKPVIPIPSDVTAIHGISDFDVIDAQSWQTVQPSVLGILCQYPCVTYNATYDRHAMHTSDEANNLRHTDYKNLHTIPMACAMLAFAEFYADWDNYHGGYRWQKLEKASVIVNHKHINAHTALGDALATLAVIKYLQSTFL
jgi:DNA polymerase III subunit epsilon